MTTLNLKQKKYIDEETLKRIISIGINFGERLNTIETNCITDFSEDKLYLKGEACYNNGYIYRAKISTQGAWVDTRWEKVGDDITELTLDEIKTMLGLTTEQLTTLSSIILDSEVRLDKTFSSSKIYMDIQDAIDTSKAYTLSELGKISGASYKVVSSTSEMSDEKIIYLLNNGTTFDMYIVDNGTPTKIGDTDIDLSNYYTKTEIDNDFLKKTDATSTYATKTELGDKVDKTSILSGISGTPSDEKVLSEKATKVELDKKANDSEVVKKTDITTTIDGSSTDSQVPSAKATYIGLNGKLDKVIELSDGANANHISATGIYKCNNWLNAPEGLPDNSGVLIVTNYMSDSPNRQYYFSQEFITPHKSDRYIRSYVKNSIGTWKKVCTTSIEDVPVTNIAPADTTTFVNFAGNATCNYCVRNGNCYISLWGVKVTSTGNTIRTNVFLPKVANVRAGTLMTGRGDATCHAFAFILDNGELCFDIKDANIELYGSFSYPVAES